jgi:hypothetical protein
MLFPPPSQKCRLLLENLHCSQAQCVPLTDSALAVVSGDSERLSYVLDPPIAYYPPCALMDHPSRKLCRSRADIRIALVILPKLAKIPEESGKDKIKTRLRLQPPLHVARGLTRT